MSRFSFLVVWTLREHYIWSFCKCWKQLNVLWTFWNPNKRFLEKKSSMNDVQIFWEHYWKPDNFEQHSINILKMFFFWFLHSKFHFFFKNVFISLLKKWDECPTKTLKKNSDMINVLTMFLRRILKARWLLLKKKMCSLSLRESSESVRTCQLGSLKTLTL